MAAGEGRGWATGPCYATPHHRARLASQVPIRQLLFRHDPAGLPALTDAILADLAGL